MLAFQDSIERDGLYTRAKEMGHLAIHLNVISINIETVVGSETIMHAVVNKEVVKMDAREVVGLQEELVQGVVMIVISINPLCISTTRISLHLVL